MEINTPQIVIDDPWLNPYVQDIIDRMQRYRDVKSSIQSQALSLEKFATAHHFFGFNYDKKAKGWWFREWAPAAYSIHLIGDFNNWDRTAHPLSKNEKGVWEIFLDDETYSAKLIHGSKVKIYVHAANGSMDRIPAYIKKTYQDPDNHAFSGVFWNPPIEFKWEDKPFVSEFKKMPLIYEVHIGMSLEKEGVATFREFADQILPRIKNLGYNTIQIMAVAEHPYYGSFGYHVSNFFAPSARFGTPEDLKYLINESHKAGIAVIMDIVHSHAVKNIAEGLAYLDGSEDLYFHPGGRGYHEQWDSYLFNYGKREVLQFLLSNLRYWMEDFHFDGFRFDGVTSMLYFHHGNFISFDHYDKYFKEGVDWDALTYLSLANDLIHTLNPQAITICEDMSGMPGGCRSLEHGGLGFDFRLGMGIPDYWIKILKHQRDEDWNIHELYHTLVNRRWKEKTIAYAESHDQALVGDKTLAFWLMDKDMYWHMLEDDSNLVIERGIALHKLIRLITLTLGGEGYMNFIGNEFGHPEWIDFPREGNGWSYAYCRRQWSLVDKETLKYKFLNNFDRDMIHWVRKTMFLDSISAQQLNMDDTNKVIVFERNNYVFVFNFSPTNSIFDYRFRVPQRGPYRILLNSDARIYGGHGRIDTHMDYHTRLEDDQHILSLYLTNRTALVLGKKLST